MNTKAPLRFGIPILWLGMIFCTYTYGQAGSLDLGFDPGSGYNANVLGMAEGSDGSVVVVGAFTNYNGTTINRISRLDPNGVLDGTFAIGTGANGNVVDVELLPGNGMFLGGAFFQFNGVQARRVVKLLPNGTVDSGFSAGIPGPNAQVNTIAVQSDGKVVIGGTFTEVGGVPRNRIARLNANGTLDTGFDPGAGANADVTCVDVLEDGRILVGGHFTSFNGTARSSAAVLNTDGSLDNTFAIGAGFNSFVFACLALPDGTSMWAGSFSTFDGVLQRAIAHLDANGSAVAGFQNLMPFGSEVFSIAPLPTGGFVLGGVFTGVGTHVAPNVAVIDGTGSPDVNFVPGAGPSSQPLAIEQLASGRLLLGGTFSSYDGITRNRIARIEGPCDPVMWFADVDADGFGDANSAAIGCTAPTGFVGNDDDCDDTNDQIGVGTTWYRDLDGDEYGDHADSIVACLQPLGYEDDNFDCDDTDPTIAVDNACDDVDPYTANDALLPWPNCGCLGQSTVISAKAFLEGPYDPTSGLMCDDLRVAGLIPLTEPYTALGYPPADGSAPSGDTMDPAVLNVTGPNAIVDWVVLEIRAGFDGSQRLSTRFALIQRDGDIVEADGFSPVRFPLGFGFRRLAVLHRNHMGIVENTTSNGSYYETSTADLTSAAFVPFGGVSSRVQIGDVWLLRAGDTSFDDEVQYVGQGNDRDPILVRIGGGVPTNTSNGYFTEDVNMDGVVKYTGAQNDRDPILVTVGGGTPTNIRPHVYLFPSP